MTLGDPVVRSFLAQSRVARIASRSAKGWPALTPLWFVCAGGVLYATTGRDTLAARNAAATPEVTVLLDAEAGGPSANVLRLRGLARVRDGIPAWPILARLALKYYVGGWRSELAHASLWSLRQRYYAQGRGVTIEIEPEDAELLRRPG